MRHQMEKLLRDGKTDLLDKFISAKKRPFNAMLTLSREGKLGWEFAPRVKKEGAARKKKKSKIIEVSAEEKSKSESKTESK